MSHDRERGQRQKTQPYQAHDQMLLESQYRRPLSHPGSRLENQGERNHSAIRRRLLTVENQERSGG